AHSGRNHGGRTIGPALRAGHAFARNLRKPVCGFAANSSFLQAVSIAYPNRISGPRSVRPEIVGIAEPDAQCQTPVAQVVQRDRLPCDLLDAPPRERSDHRPDTKAVRLESDGAECHPRLGPRADTRPIPPQKAVPTPGLNNPCEARQQTWIRQLVERCQVQSALHGSSPWEPRRRSTHMASAYPADDPTA